MDAEVFFLFLIAIAILASILCGLFAFIRLFFHAKKICRLEQSFHLFASDLSKERPQGEALSPGEKKMERAESDLRAELYRLSARLDQIERRIQGVESGAQAPSPDMAPPPFPGAGWVPPVRPREPEPAVAGIPPSPPYGLEPAMSASVSTGGDAAEIPAGGAAGGAPPEPISWEPPSGAPGRLEIWVKNLLGGPKPVSFEQFLGTRFLAWIGMILTLVGAAFFLKYMYDNSVIGPRGRLAIGVLTSLAAMIAGEHFRRKDWKPLFQVLSGGGIAGLYICIYFSFQIYHLAGQTTAFLLAACVTFLAVALAVFHNALSIAILALLGGFLSPVLLSTGQNHPHALFLFILLLDGVALGAAYFRRWRALDVLAFAGTVILYLGWFEKFYGLPEQPSQMFPALLYISLFYLFFLLIPSLHSLVRRLPQEIEGIVLIGLNAILSFWVYYRILIPDYRHALGFVVLGQALLVFGLFLIWLRRLGEDRRAAESLLIVALALAIVAIPLHLKMYGIPIAWAAEGFLFVYLGGRFKRLLVRLGGLVALSLAIGNLLSRLPLHSEIFTPVFNIPFGSWVFVIAAVAASGVLYSRVSCETDCRYFAPCVFLGAFVMGGLLLSLETCDFWRVRYVQMDLTGQAWRWYEMHLMTSLLVLWTLISAATLEVFRRKSWTGIWLLLPAACHTLAVMLFIGGLPFFSKSNSPIFAVNEVFPYRLLLIAELWWAAKVIACMRNEKESNIPLATAHVLLALLLAVEIPRWIYGMENKAWQDFRLHISLISAAWGVHACVLVAGGLARRKRILRILGFILFGITALKVLFVDTSQLEQVYRIVSFVATGLLMILAGYFYHRFSGALLKEGEKQIV